MVCPFERQNRHYSYCLSKILDGSKLKPNKIWVDKAIKIYNRSVKLWLQSNDIEMYSTGNKGKPVIPERFIRILKKKFTNI